jgi:hypothetical protein
MYIPGAGAARSPAQNGKGGGVAGGDGEARVKEYRNKALALLKDSKSRFDVDTAMVLCEVVCC